LGGGDSSDKVSEGREWGGVSSTEKKGDDTAQGKPRPRRRKWAGRYDDRTEVRGSQWLACWGSGVVTHATLLAPGKNDTNQADTNKPTNHARVEIRRGGVSSRENRADHTVRGKPWRSTVAGRGDTMCGPKCGAGGKGWHAGAWVPMSATPSSRQKYAPPRFNARARANAPVDSAGRQLIECAMGRTLRGRRYGANATGPTLRGDIERRGADVRGK
jgi:hypothetical protein